MDKFILILIVLCGLIIADDGQVSAGVEEEPSVAEEVEETLRENLRATQSEDSKGVLATMHSQSPSYNVTGRQLSRIFAAYDLKYELLSYKFVALDGEYAICRIKQKTTKVAGGPFTNNVLDAYVVLKQEDKMWKIWSQANLSIDFVK